MRTELTMLLDRGDEVGCLELSRVSELFQELDVDEDETQTFYEQAHDRGIEIQDDCGQDQPDSTYVNGDLAVATTDALQLFLNEAGRYPLLTAAEEVELAKRV